MKQLGNLAIICANRADVALVVQYGKFTVYMDRAPETPVMCADWDDDGTIGNMVFDLNYGKYKEETR